MVSFSKVFHSIEKCEQVEKGNFSFIGKGYQIVFSLMEKW